MLLGNSVSAKEIVRENIEHQGEAGPLLSTGAECFIATASLFINAVLYCIDTEKGACTIVARKEIVREKIEHYARFLCCSDADELFVQC